MILTRTIIAKCDMCETLSDPIDLTADLEVWDPRGSAREQVFAEHGWSLVSIRHVSDTKDVAGEFSEICPACYEDLLRWMIDRRLDAKEEKANEHS